MIPGLLHGRLLSAAISGLIASPAYQSISASATAQGSAQAVATFTINPDGSWSGSGTGQAIKSGLWFDPQAAGAGSAYEVRITPSGSGGSVSNPASGWVALSSARSLSITSQRFEYGTTSASYSVTVEIRASSGGAVLSSGSFTATASATVPMPNYIPGLTGRGVSAVDQALTGQSTVAASVSIDIGSNGAWSVYGTNSQGSAPIGSPTTGTWNIYGGSSESYDVLFTASVSGTGQQAVTNGAASWSALSATRSFNLRLPSFSAANSVQRNGDASLRIQIRRRATGEIVSDTSLSLSVTTQGYQ